MYWESADQNPSVDFDTVEWASVWRPLPKVVFSTTLSAVEGSGGIPFYPQRERRLDLELIDSRTFSSRFVYLRYRVTH